MKGLQRRSLVPEIMDQTDPPVEIARKFHRDLALIHRVLGNWDAIAARLRDVSGDGARGGGVSSVIDVGCGDGALLRHIREKLGVESVIGIDLKPPACGSADVPVLVMDATRRPLPVADVAIAVMMLHHLTEDQVVALIRNVGRSVKRFICLDPVRHPLPMALYTVFLCPFLSRIGAADGRQSIRRSFRPEELKSLVDRAVRGTGASFDHSVSRVYARQIIDISF